VEIIFDTGENWIVCKYCHAIEIVAMPHEFCRYNYAKNYSNVSDKTEVT